MDDNNKDEMKHSVFSEIRETKKNYKPVHYLDRGFKRHIENTLFFIFGFILPPVGIVIWAYIHESRPKDAIYPLIAAIIGSTVILMNVFAPLFFL